MGGQSTTRPGNNHRRGLQQDRSGNGHGRLAAGGGVARRGIEIDPYSDDLWRLAIDSSERCGDAVQAAVLRTSYEHLVSTLDKL